MLKYLTYPLCKLHIAFGIKYIFSPSVYVQDPFVRLLLFSYPHSQPSGYYGVANSVTSWALYCTLGNFSKPVETIILLKSPTF